MPAAREWRVATECSPIQLVPESNQPAETTNPDRGAAWNPFVERLTPRLWAWAQLRLGPRYRNRVDPGDLVQLIWLRAMKLHTQPPHEGQVFSIAGFVLLEAVRSAQRQGELLNPEGGTTAMQRLEQWQDSVTEVVAKRERNERAELLWTEVQRWDNTDREIFRRVGIEQVGQSKVATELGMTRDAVAKRWQRIRERLLTNHSTQSMFWSDD